MGYDTNNCVTVDPRGEAKNWEVVPCDSKRTFICEFPISEATREQCFVFRASINDDLPEEYVPPYDVCTTSGRYTLQECEAITPLENPICDMGDLTIPECELKCCDGCLCTRRLTTGDMLSIIVGGLLGVLSLFVLTVAVFLARKRKKRILSTSRLE